MSAKKAEMSYEEIKADYDSKTPEERAKDLKKAWKDLRNERIEVSEEDQKLINETFGKPSTKSTKPAKKKTIAENLAQNVALGLDEDFKAKAKAEAIAEGLDPAIAERGTVMAAELAKMCMEMNVDEHDADLIREIMKCNITYDEALAQMHCFKEKGGETTEPDDNAFGMKKVIDEAIQGCHKIKKKLTGMIVLNYLL